MWSDGSFKEDLDFAQVVFVNATQGKSGAWQFDVSVRHRDEGWSHYADAWQVEHPESGKIIAERVLLHPHETEQPFTRSQEGVEVPAGLLQVRIRAKCNVHGFGGREVIVPLDSNNKTDLFEVRRAS